MRSFWPAAFVFVTLLISPQIISAGTTFSDAQRISPSSFMAGLKEVSVGINVTGDVLKKVSLSELERLVAQSLKPYGIVVNQSAPVVLVVSFGHSLTDFSTTTTYTDGSKRRHDSYFHNVAVTADFVLTTAVLRNGKFYWADVSPAHGYGSWGWTTGIDSPGSTYERYFSSELDDSLKSISSNHDKSGEESWYADTWTPQKKARINAEFAQIMSQKAAMAKIPGPVGHRLNLSGLDIDPRLNLVPKGQTANFVDEGSWREAWGQQLARAGLVQKTAHPPLFITHYVTSSWETISNMTKLFGISSGPPALLSFEYIALEEPDVVFPFKGQMVRSTVVLADLADNTACMRRQDRTVFPNAVLGMVKQFGTDLSAAKRYAPLKAVRSRPVHMAHGKPQSIPASGLTVGQYRHMPAVERRAAVKKIFRAMQGNFRALSPSSPNFKYKPVYLNFTAACCEVDPKHPGKIPLGYKFVDNAAEKAAPGESLQKLVVNTMSDEFANTVSTRKVPKDKQRNVNTISYFRFMMRIDLEQYYVSKQLAAAKQQAKRAKQRLYYLYDYTSIVLPDGRHVVTDKKTGGFLVISRDGSTSYPLTGQAVAQARQLNDCILSRGRAACGQPVPPQSTASNPPPAPAPQTTSPAPAAPASRRTSVIHQRASVNVERPLRSLRRQTIGRQQNSTGTLIARRPAAQPAGAPQVNVPKPVPVAPPPPQPKPQPALPPSAHLTSVPLSITEGQSAVLSWTAQNATSVSVQPGVGSVQANGSVKVTPRMSTTYILTARGAGRFAIARVTVNVLPAGPSHGTIVWEGDVHGTTPVSIEGKHASVGTIVSGGLPGLPCTVRLENSNRATLQTSPAQWNGWKLLLLQIHGNGRVTVRIDWSLQH